MFCSLWLVGLLTRERMCGTWGPRGTMAWIPSPPQLFSPGDLLFHKIQCLGLHGSSCLYMFFICFEGNSAADNHREEAEITNKKQFE